MAITEKVKKKIEGVTEDLKESIDTLKEKEGKKGGKERYWT